MGERKNDIGFMQGRLSPIIDGKIQSFPWTNWENEIVLASDNGFHLMEWTLDQERLYENPLMTKEGQKRISELCSERSFSIPSLTGDCFMQAPFYKKSGSERASLLQDFKNIISACSTVGINYIVFPLVDDGRLENKQQESEFVAAMLELVPLLEDKNVKVVFESDYAPQELAQFIEKLPSHLFGINYDSGNSASLGYKPDEEFGAYADRILNVHIKDRVLRGTTVPLGTGDCDFDSVFSALKKMNYNGNLILQAARAADDNHIGALLQYKSFVQAYLG